MYEQALERKRHDRLPEDSGEWHAIPLKFRRLPKPTHPWVQPQLSLPTVFNRWATLLPLVQLLVGLGSFYAIACIDGSAFTAGPVLTVPTLIGFISAIYLVLGTTDGMRMRARSIIATTMRAQLWWGLLLLIPCYGWGVLFLCVPQCVVGTLAGTLAACVMRTRHHDRPAR